MRDAEAGLFEEWGRGKTSFVRDGVVDWDCYSSVNPKILFVLKEVNDPDGGGWDLREFLRQGGRPQTWNNVTRWIRGLQELENDLRWEEVEEMDEAKRREYLRCIAALNLKKTPGSHTSDWKDVSAAAAQDRHFIVRQVEICSADITICCGVGDAFRWIMGEEKAGKWERTKRGIHYFRQPSRKPVVAYSHPEARVADCLLYYGLIDAVREILAPGTS